VIMKRLFTSFSILLTASVLWAQPTTLWTKIIGGSQYDRGNSVSVVNTDGTPTGYIIVGSTKSFGFGDYDLWLIKTDLNGNVSWKNTFGGSGFDTGYAVEQINDNNFIITGRTNSFGSGGFDIWLLKVDSQGNEIWSWSIGTSNDEVGYDVDITSDGGFIITGLITRSSGERDIILVKTDADANLEWDKSFGSTNGVGDEAFSVKQTSDDGFIIAGGTNVGGAWLIKTNVNGEEVWNKDFSYSWGNAVEQTSDGGYIFSTRNSLIKTNSSGVEEWTNYTSSNYAQQTLDGGYVFAQDGNSNSSGKITIYKTNSSGNEEWSKTLNDQSTTEVGGRSIEQTADGGYIITGGTFDNQNGSSDVLLVKTAGIAPAAPTGLTGAYGYKQVDLSWNKNSESDLSKYYIYKGGVLVDSTTASDTTATITGLTNGTEYSFRIKAVDDYGNISDYSNEFKIAPRALLKVPSVYGKIDYAIAAAESGDTILISPGTYN